MNREDTLVLLNKLSEILQDLSVDSKYIDAIDESINTIHSLTIKEQEEKKLMKSLAEELKGRIGTHIYWACKGWSIEKHIISSVKYDIYHSDFFNKEYDGKRVVKIYTDDDNGFYIYNDLGKTIFFSIEEAEKSLSS